MFSGRELVQLERTMLADVMRRNTGVTTLQDNVFFFQAEVAGVVYLDLASSGRQDRNEIVLRGVTVELLDDAGEVLASMETRRTLWLYSVPRDR